MKHLLLVVGITGLLYIIFWASPVNNDYKFVKVEIFGAEECEALSMSTMFVGAGRITKMLERRINEELDSSEVSWYGGAVRKAALMKRIKECVGE